GVGDIAMRLQRELAVVRRGVLIDGGLRLLEARLAVAEIQTEQDVAGFRPAAAVDAEARHPAVGLRLELDDARWRRAPVDADITRDPGRLLDAHLHAGQGFGGGLAGRRL